MCCKCCEDRQDRQDRGEVVIPLVYTHNPPVEFLPYEVCPTSAETAAQRFNAWMRSNVSSKFYRALQIELR